ncbi:helix-turn-helix domain-containing protein [Bacillus paralicheniformis]|uniref:helix-turn-helix domain-containing protein n=1 Tax=Bacillus paralicheniformis TaxID=1648923 RepID=UPI00128E46E9|nr:helix-turn-helix domain-containing protein [Bacillus paralicheniformis]MPQ25365.1 PucR family transcriptional regulator [Bacillus paralicheniformis]
MLEKLKTLYGERMIVSEAVSKHDALWFQTDEGETFGVLKNAVTDPEKELLHCLFRPFSEPHPEQQLTKRETEWHQYFFRDAPLPNPGNIQLMQSHFFKMEHAPEERQAIKEAVSGFFKDPLVVWYDRHEAIIVHENPSPFLAKKELSELAHALTSDFMANPVFFSGQLHPVNGSLQGKVRFEKQMFHHMLEAGDIGNVATFCQCLPSFLTAKPERVHASSFSDAVSEALSDPETSLTIKTYMRCNLNASLTAKRLFIHRNSLQYRIDKFIERTAIDIRQFEEAAAVYLMMHLL